MLKVIKSLRSNIVGAALVEFSLLLPLIMIMTTGLVEVSYVLYQFNSAQKATQIGAQFASTRDSVVTGITDCGVATTLEAGTNCEDVAGASSWTITCNGGAGGGNCNATTMAEIFAKMQAVYPQIELANMRIEFSGTGLGFVGRGRPVPAITVTLENLQYDYIAFGQILGLQNTSKLLTKARTTVIAEDLKDGA